MRWLHKLIQKLTNKPRQITLQKLDTIAHHACKPQKIAMGGGYNIARKLIMQIARSSTQQAILGHLSVSKMRSRHCERA